MPRPLDAPSPEFERDLANGGVLADDADPGGDPDQADGGTSHGAAARANSGRVAADLPGLPIARFTRRRMLWVAVALASIWIVIGFTRQIRDASAATARADSLRAGNAALADQVGALKTELVMIQRQEFIAIQARAYGLGGRHEIPFTLDPGAPPLPSNAPGAGSVRLGGEADSGSPVDSWLSLLFGPSP